MRKSVVLISTLINWQMLAQTAPKRPSGTFDLQLENRTGLGAAVSFFVARKSHLYFAISHANGSVVLQTTEDGVVQSMGAASSEQISGFDVDDRGNSFVLYGNSRLAEFNNQWKLEQTENLQPAIESFAVVGGKPMGISQNGKLGFLGTSVRAFTLEAYPAPWSLFAAGFDRIGILRPKGQSLHVLQVDGLWSTHTVNLAYRKPLAVAVGPDSQLYILEAPTKSGVASVIKCSDQGNPLLVFDQDLPGSFNPQMIGILGDQIYIVDPKGRVAFYPLYQKPSAASQVIEAMPELLSGHESLNAALKRSGYTGPVLIKVKVSQEGMVENAALQVPATLNTLPEVMEVIQGWRFRPATHSGQTVAATLTMSFGAR